MEMSEEDVEPKTECAKNAAEKLLDINMQGMDAPSRRSARRLYVLNTGAGSFIDAVFSKRHLYSLPIFYQALVSDA